MQKIVDLNITASQRYRELKAKESIIRGSSLLLNWNCSRNSSFAVYEDGYRYTLRNMSWILVLREYRDKVFSGLKEHSGAFKRGEYPDVEKTWAVFQETVLDLSETFEGLWAEPSISETPALRIGDFEYQHDFRTSSGPHVFIDSETIYFHKGAEPIRPTKSEPLISQAKYAVELYHALNMKMWSLHVGAETFS